MRDYYTLKINAPAGILTPNHLRQVLTLALDAGVRKVRFGARQQLLMTVHYESLPFLEKALNGSQIAYEVNTDRYPNIISSYCGEEVFRSGDWLRESEYHAILDQFDYRPELKINLSDSGQSFTPFFTGHINFIASPEPHFWYVYIRRRKSNTIFRWRELLYTHELGRFAQAIEANFDTEEATLIDRISSLYTFISQPATQEVELPEFSLPYYEGFNRYGSRTWLGLYRRDEWFSVHFLLDLCELSLRNRIGEICITPWKSLIIKGISEEHRGDWSYILGKHNINVRHAANELAWQIEDDSDEGTALKQQVIRHFEKNDTRTFGLCFGIQTRPQSEVFGSILIRKRPWVQLGELKLGTRYDLYITDQFNPNSRSQILVEKGLFRMHVPLQLERLCRKFSALRSPRTVVQPVVEETHTETPAVHQCPHCYTVYDEIWGDARNQIAPGTPFQALPETYTCSTCDAPKSEFLSVQLELQLS